MAEVEMYHYTALPTPDHIRILTLCPATDVDAEICCRIEAASIATAKYDALSYSWGMNADGDASLSRSIWIEGMRAQVTQNLFEGLRRIRHTVESTRLWIDAVCINQADLTERSAQVARMADIYSNCQRVIMWLGGGSSEEDDLAAKKLLHDIDSHVDVRSCNTVAGERRYRRCVLACILQTSMGCDCERPSENDQSVQSKALPDDWYDVSGMQVSIKAAFQRLGTELTAELEHVTKPLAIFKRRYWSRRWIVQEVYHSRAQTWYWGPCQHDVTDLIDPIMSILADALGTIHSVIKSLDHDMRTTRRLRWWEMVSKAHQIARLDSANHVSRGNRSMATLLRAFATYDCQDPRDRLFALLSLYRAYDVVPDYELSYGQTTILCTELLLKEFDPQPWLSTLCERRHYNNTELDKPSWAIDLCDGFSRATNEFSQLIEPPTMTNGMLTFPSMVDGVLTCRIRNFGTIDPAFSEEPDTFTLSPDEICDTVASQCIPSSIEGPVTKTSARSRLRQKDQTSTTQLSTDLARSVRLKQQAALILLHRADYCRQDPEYDPDFVQKLRHGDILCSFYSSGNDGGGGPVGYLAILRPVASRPQTYTMLFTFGAQTLHTSDGKRIQATNLYFTVRTVRII